MCSTATEENNGWTVNTCNETSGDGKTFTSTRVATTSGTDKIDNGIANYAAKSEMKSSVFMDGDDKNFTKSVGSSASNVIKQEASGGDENSKFSASSTSTSSSSRYVTEARSTSEDIIPVQGLSSGGGNVVTKTYTTNVPEELKSHPNYVEGRTKVTTETRTLADGTVVKTTRYETKGNQIVSSSSKQQESSATSHHDVSSRRSSTSSTTSKADKIIKKEIDIQPTIVESKQSSSFVKSSSQQSQNFQTSSNETVRVSSSNKHDSEYIDDTGADKIMIRHVETTPRLSEIRIIGGDNTVSSSSSETVKISSVSQEVKQSADVRQATSVHSTKQTIAGDVTDDSSKYTKIDLTPTIVQSKTITTTTGGKSVDVKQEATSTTTKATTEKNMNTSSKSDDVKIVQASQLKDFDNETQKAITDGSVQTRVIKETTTTKRIIDDHQPITHTTTTTKVTHHNNDNVNASEHFVNVEKQQESANIETINKHHDNFIDVERQHAIDTETPHYAEQIPEKQWPCEESPTYDTPERRQPIRPGKSEFDDKPKPTEGQYDTTYRSDFTNKRISVDVSPTHNAFARSLRAISPDRSSKCSSPSRGSTRSLTSAASDRRQSDRRSVSPTKPIDKFASNETITKSPRSSPTKTDHVINTDTITRKSKVTNRSQTDVDVRKQTSESRTYSSDTLTRKKKVTKDDLVDTTETYTIDDSSLKRRPKTKPRSRSNSPTSTVSDFEYVKNTNEQVTDLDEEITRHKTTRITTDVRPTTLNVITTKQTKKILERSPTSPLPSPNKQRQSPTKETPNRRSSLKSPTKETSPVKRTDTYEERCRQILGIKAEKKSPEKPTSPTKIKEFPSETRKSPEKNKASPSKDHPPQLQIRKSPTKESSEKAPGKIKPQLHEFPSQVRKTPERQPLHPYPEKGKPSKEISLVQEFPSQIQKSSKGEPLGPYPEKKKPYNEAPSVQEFPSQIRKSPEKEPLQPYPEKQKPCKEAPALQEFPSQIRKSPEKELLEAYPEKQKPFVSAPSVQEFPSQVRKSPVKEPLEPYPEKQKPFREAPSLYEFPSQVRKTPEKEPLEPHPVKEKPSNEAPSVQEFPSQIRKSPEKELLRPYPEKQRPDKEAPSLQEFPSQIRKSPEREPLESYPEKQKPRKEAPSVQEYPSQIRKSPEKEILESYPEKRKPSKNAPLTQEFPPQERKSPEKELLEPYPEKIKPTKEVPSVQEFPSQIRKSPEKGLLEPYPEKTQPHKEAPCVQEFPSQIRKSPVKEPLPQYPEKTKPQTQTPSVQEFPSQTRKQYPQKPKTAKDVPSGQVRDKPSAPHSPDVKKQPKKPRKSSQSSSSSSDDEGQIEITEVDKQINIDKARKDKTQDFIETEISVEHSQRLRPTKATKSPERKPSGVSEVTVTKTTTHKTELEKKSIKKSPQKPVKETPLKKSPDSKTFETRTPVKEPEFVKKFAYTLGSEEERKNAQHKTVKKDLSRTIEKEALLEKAKPKSTVTNKLVSKTITERKDSQNKFNIDSRRNEVVVQRLHETITKSKPLLNGDVKKRPSDVSPKAPGESKPSPKPATPKKSVIKINVTNGKVTNATTQINKVKTATQTATPKRHVVTTTLTVSPKTKQPDVISRTKTTTTRTTTTKSKITTKQPKKPKLQNGHISTDSENESDTETTQVTTTETRRVVNGKVDVDEKTTKVSKTHGKTPTQSQPAKTKPETKCVTTKSIVINNEVSAPTEIVVDLQRSKSSREPTPDRSCAFPVSSDDDTGVPRYPDKVTEPDDGSLRRKPKKLSDIPIIETEVVTDFSRITDVSSKKDSFIEEEIKREEAARRAPSLPKNDEQPDDSLLSVSDKVTKFITTAQQLTAQQNLPKRPKSPRCENYTDTNVDENDESLLSVSEKISHFATTAKKITGKAEVSKFISNEKVESDKPISLSKLDITPKRTSPAKEVPRSRLSPEKERSPSPKHVGAKEPESTPRSSRRPSGDDQKCVLSSVSRLRSTESIKKAKALFEKIGQETPKQRDILSRPSVFQSTPRTPKKPETPAANKNETSVRSKLDFSKEETTCSVKTIEDRDTKLKSTRLILDGIKPRPSSPEKQAPHKVRPSPENDVPGYMKPLDRSDHKHRLKSPSPQRGPEVEDERSRSRESSTDRDIPGYMRPLDRSIRPHSPNREGVEALKKIGSIPKEEVDTRVSKFGVTLRRTDSGRAVKITDQRKSSTATEETLEIDKEIEDIYDLEVLEVMVSFNS